VSLLVWSLLSGGWTSRFWSGLVLIRYWSDLVWSTVFGLIGLVYYCLGHAKVTLNCSICNAASLLSYAPLDNLVTPPILSLITPAKLAEELDAHHHVFLIFLSMQRLLIELRALPGAKVVGK